MPNHDTIVLTRDETKTQRPRKWHVVMHNDDFTPMPFVTEVLCTIFNHSYDNAFQIMMTVHREGRAVAGTYTHEIAEQKVLETMDLARQFGYPLLCNAQPE